MGNKEEIKRIDGKYYLVRELEMDGEPVPHESGMLQRVKSIDGYDCQHCVLFGTDICDVPCSPYGFMVRVLPENSEEKDEENLSNVEKTGKNLETEKEETTMERKIGEIFEYDSEWYQTVEAPIDEHSCNGCQGCKGTGGPRISGGECNGNARKDGKFVIFKKLKKVGEPYAHNSAIVQKYRIRTIPVIMPNDPYMYFNAINNTIEIEIKQNKEDMEENELIELLSEKVHNAWMKEKEAQGFSYGKEYDKEKKKHPDMLPYNELKEEVKEYDRATVKAVLQAQKELSADVNKLNLKPFSLEAAKAGKPVCTRDGRKARIVCFDRVTNFTNEYTGNLIVLVTNPNGDEQSFYYTEKGYLAGGNEYDNHKWGLMMLPEKKEGWINVCKSDLYKDKEIALHDAKQLNDYIDTVKVEWEE